MILLSAVFISSFREFLIDDHCLHCTALLDQQQPAVAYDGTRALVIWEDWREGEDIFATRVDAGGTLIDTAGSAISMARGQQFHPAVSFDGLNYFAVWEDCRNRRWELYGARIRADGGAGDTAGFRIFRAGTSPVVSFDGRNYLVCWMQTDGIHGARVSTDAVVLDTGSITISRSRPGKPGVVFGGSNYLVTWNENRNGNQDIFGARVTTEGTILDTAGISICAAGQAQCSTAVAFDGNNYFVVWSDERSGAPDIFGARVDAAGVVLDPAGIPISVSIGEQINPSVAFDGINYLVVWQDGRGASHRIYCSRVTPEGVVLDTPGLPISPGVNSEEKPAVVSAGTSWFVVWQSLHEPLWSLHDIYGSRVSGDGTVLDPAGISLSRAANAQWSPSVCSDGRHYLTVWEDHRSGEFQRAYICGARTDTSGNVLDTLCLHISDKLARVLKPVLAHGGSNYLVVWEKEDDIVGKRVSSAGAIVDTQEISLCTDLTYQGWPEIACNGSSYFAVWNDYRMGNSQVFGTRVTFTGSVADTGGIQVSRNTLAAMYMDVASDGVDYFVAWMDLRRGASNPDIFGTRVTSGGIVLDTNAVEISAGFQRESYPRIAFGGGNYLVMWLDRRRGADLPDLYCARLTRTGQVLDTAGLLVAESVNNPDDLISQRDCMFDGNAFLCLWMRYEASGYGDVYGARISPSGIVIDTFVVSSHLYWGHLVNGCRGPGNQGQIVFSRYVGRPYNISRIWGTSYGRTQIDDSASSLRVRGFEVPRICPNPFTNATSIYHSRANASTSKLVVYNAAGLQVRTLRCGQRGNREGVIIWDGLDHNGCPLPAGVYFVQLKTDARAYIQKAVKLR